MNRFRPLPSSPFVRASCLVSFLTLGLSLLPGGPASAAQIEGNTIGMPLHSASTDRAPSRAPVDAGATRDGSAGAPRGAGTSDGRAGARPPAAPVPASGAHRGH